MSKNLVIVESPAKAKTIEKFLGKDFIVKSSMGHIRDLPEKELGIDINNHFEPKYVILPNKSKIINELKDASQKADTIWLATDSDREGEAISWHLLKALNIDPEKAKRIVFHEITEKAIKEAILSPRLLNIDLINAQQARRVLDRLVGFELSPLLWRKVKPALSAGRVQSVTVRLIVEREKEIHQFNAYPIYRVVGKFFDDKKNTVQAELNTRFKTEQEAEAFLKKCINAAFTVSAIEQVPTKKMPAPPFTTSTLQQEAARKLNFSVAKTMLVAQQLYEAGHITYMRTDSVNLSHLALASAKEEITKTYGEKYAKTRQYQTKSKGAQEAHEAIRPTYLNKHSIKIGDTSQERLYDLIWKRTIASQMSEAKLEKTIVSIDISNASEKFTATGEVLIFDGFLKVYIESHDDNEEENNVGSLPALKQNMPLEMEQIQAVEKYSQQPPRYTEASLVRKLEELGIGRPSTYAPTISTIQKREYVVKGNVEGFEREHKILTLKKEKITSSTKKEKIGFEKGKLIPTDIGQIVNDFLTTYFQEIMDYHFTANIEKKFDEIAEGAIEWKSMISDFYRLFHQQVKTTMDTSTKASGERLLGVDPVSGKNVYAKLARFGPVVQIGDTNKNDLKFAKLLPSQSINTITLQEALDLFKLPRTIVADDGSELIINTGKFGPYICHNKKFYSIPKHENLFEITLERCLEIIEEKNEKEKAKTPIIIGNYNEMDVSVAVGKYGPYILYNKQFYKLPTDTDIKTVKLDTAISIIEETISKNTLKSFEEDKKIKILKDKRKGAYLTDGKNNYYLPKDKNYSELTLADCKQIIKESTEKSKKK